MRAPLRRPALLALVLSACASWQPQAVTPRVLIADQRPSRAQLTLTDSSVVEMRDPVIRGDSVSGEVNGRTRAVPLDQVAYLSLRRGSGTAKPLLISVVLVGGVLGLVAATMND